MCPSLFSTRTRVFVENSNWSVKRLDITVRPTLLLRSVPSISTGWTAKFFPILHPAFNRGASMARRRSSMDVHFAGQISDGNRLPSRTGDLRGTRRTFTPEGTFEAIITRLDHLKKIGVNAIELMPVADFAGDRNWGYDCVSIYAPSRAYGRPDGLRTLVNAAHAAGMAVILDVVDNHLGPDGNYMGVYSEDYFNPAHHTPWGAAFNLDSPGAEPVRQLFADNPVYWVNEFHIDGFRLDATQAIPDDSPKHLVQEIAERAQALGAFVICEDPRNERKFLLPRTEGGYGCDAVWADDFHHVTRVQMTREREGYMGYFEGTMEELVKTMGEGWLFTGELQKDGIPRGTPGRDIEPEHFIHCISNHDQIGIGAYGDRLNKVVPPAAYRAASAFLLTGPYAPMLFMGQEWAASSPFLYFTDHHDELEKGSPKGAAKNSLIFRIFEIR